jgi:hypothetical protein
VNNNYVRRKLLVFMALFLNKDWKRIIGGVGQPAPPSVDADAPDLHIPTMSLVTYVLLSGLLYGNSENSRPRSSRTWPCTVC